MQTCTTTVYGLSISKGGILMRTLIFQTLEFTVLIPGMLLAYLPVRSSLKQTPEKLAVWMLPLLIICSCFCGFACYRFHLSTRSVLLPLLFVLLVLYHNTLLISLWKSVSIYLAVCAVFSCFSSAQHPLHRLQYLSRLQWQFPYRLWSVPARH